MQEILLEIWVRLQPMFTEVIVIIVTVLLGKFALPKLFRKALKFIFKYIPYSPIEGMAWGLVRHVAEKYPELPGEDKAYKVLSEIKSHYPWFPADKIITIIKTQYRIWQGELLNKKRGIL